MKKRLLYLNILFPLISALAIMSCGKSSGYNSSTSNPPPAVNAVSIVNMSFSTASLTVTAGTTVTWTNKDGMTHTVTADDNSFDSGYLAMGSKFSKVFSVKGTYTYHCSIHSTMKGTIIVK
jgi:plastocyanin